MANGPAYLSEGLERVYTDIQQERMAGVPILNPQLAVQVVGMQAWGKHSLGVLITPWFMNLMLLSSEGNDWHDLPLGSSQRHVFPSGPYEFIVGEEAGIGRYQMCSLFSPMFDFADQGSAVATAEAVMDAIMCEKNHEVIDARSPDTPPPAVTEDRPALGERMDQPLSRRDLLRGAFLRYGQG